MILARERSLGLRLAPVPGDHPRAWTVRVDGEKVQAETVELEYYDPVSGAYRRMRYGLVLSEGNVYPSIAYRESGGGGTVNVLWFMHEDELYIGVVVQQRAHMGDEAALCAPGGYLDTAKCAFDSAIAELDEEVRVDASVFCSPVQLPGKPVCLARSLTDCSEPGDGVLFFASQVRRTSLLEPGSDGWFRFRADVLRAEPDPSVNTERVLEVLFMPVDEVVLRTQDACALAAIARLRTYLRPVRYPRWMSPR